MKQLAGFSISVRDEDFVLRLEDEAGEATEYAATPEQLDAVIEALDNLLADNEEDLFEVRDDGDEGQTYQKPLG